MDFLGNSTTAAPEPSPHHDYKFIIVPVVVILVVMVLSALVYLMARRKRKLATLKHKLMVLYEFDSNEQEWESLLSNENPNYSQITNTTF